MKIQKEALASNRTEITSLQSKSEKMTKAEKDRELKVQELTHNITRAKDDAGNAKRVVQDLLEQYEWISEERKFFGQPNTAYDFKATDPQEASRRIKKVWPRTELFLLLFLGKISSHLISCYGKEAEGTFN